jgi:outer membrane protein assembly factor BamD (BamD/ComL family)
MALRLLIAILILAVPAELPGCGPFLPKALFFLAGAPDAEADFARGQLGILQPTYERLYQVIAYRYLSGVGLNDAEQEAVLPSPHPVVDVPAPTVTPNPWLQARNQVPGIKVLKELSPYRQVKKEGYFDTYLNCNDDAFRTAASTLKRIQQTGAAAEWIAAQDAVFADCSQGSEIPQPAADPNLAADRTYQIASAKFYSEQYDAARQDFQAIATDASSPWHDSAPYLAARCLIRAGGLADAETELQRVVADPALTRWHTPANNLVGYVRARLHPAERMHELALALVKPNSEATIAQDLIDYRMLFDKGVKAQPLDDLTDWIFSYQANALGTLEKWRARHTIPWLIAALQSAKPTDTATAELLTAARDVKPDSPAYFTVAYHRIRLMSADDGRTLADQLLAGQLPIPARNQILAERMRLSRTFDEFLKFAPRRLVADSSYEVTKVDSKTDLLDDDSTLILNRGIPLKLLKEAAGGTILPDPLREQLKRVVSIRTLVLSGSPSFDEVFELLKMPGQRPYMDWGLGRFTAEPEKIDPFRDNWWCSAGATNIPYTAVVREPTNPNTPFLSPADRDQAAAEWEKLQAVATGPNWLAAQTLAFAKSHPQDPRVPEALYLSVRATRYGCSDKETGDFSHGAFDLLHRRYPNNEWAKKTPYWFN